MDKKRLSLIFFFLILFIFAIQTTKINIYKFNSSTDKAIVQKKISLLKILPTDKKLPILASKMSKELFNGNKINLTQIKTENGKEIAYFNLEDTDKKSWYQYFQGSSGAQETLESIKLTLLQEGLKDNWVDGIKLTYNGEFTELDHISFDNTPYLRKQVKD